MNGDSSAKHANHASGSRSRFSGRIGYVLAVAGSAVGLGNIWRFPYLAAKYGGGIFLLVYMILMLTFGYVLIVSETALGRMTGKSPVGAFHAFGKTFPFRFGGLDQRRSPHDHCPLLLRHRRLGAQIPGGISQRKRCGSGV